MLIMVFVTPYTSILITFVANLKANCCVHIIHNTMNITSDIEHIYRSLSACTRSKLMRFDSMGNKIHFFRYILFTYVSLR